MKLWILDTAERAAMTFAQAFLATFMIGDMTTVRTAGIAAAAAALSVIKSAIAARLYGTISPASVVSNV
jgi:hypothetical protein